MQMLYPLYYRQYGIRRLQQLLMPRMFQDELFTFPKNTIYHHVSHKDGDVAPNQDQTYFHNYRKRIFMDVVTQLTETKGNARRNSTQPQILYRPYFLKNRLFKFTRDAVNVNKDPQTLTAVDYGYLQKLYRYTKMPLTPYYQWYNIEKTVWDNILKTTRESERQNFLFLEVPDVIPSLAMLRMYANKVNNIFLHIFDTHEKRFILELWRWIDPATREQSLLGGFNQEDLDKVNLVLTHNGKWCVLNLGVFNKWRKEPKAVEEKEETVDKSKTPVASVSYLPMQFQKLMLKLFISVQAQTVIDPENISDHEVEGETTGGPEVKPNAETEIIEDDNEIESNGDPEITAPTNTEIDKTEKLHEIHEDTTDVESAQLDFDEQMFEDLEKDLKALEYIEQKNLMLKGINNLKEDAAPVAEVTPEKPVVKDISFDATEDEVSVIKKQIFNEHAPDVALKEYIDRHAEYGLMSAAEYRKVVKSSEEFMNSSSGYDKSKPIRDYIKIEDHELKIAKEEIKIPQISTVPDKTMLESSLITFDKKYIKNVLPKDITAMIVNIQRAGIIIQDYQIEPVSGALGAYEIHTVRVKPIDGVASTLRFKLPKIDEEGNFVANGNKYHMRKQRADKKFFIICK